MAQDLTHASTGQRWLADHWVAATWFLMAGLLSLLPFVGEMGSLPVALLFAHSPIYMAHQIEEHSGDRFRTFVNRRVFGGLTALTAADVLVINLPVVWGLNLGAFYAAWAGRPGYGLIAPCAMLLNAATHIASAIRFRGYNPGLFTSVLLFLPLSIGTLISIERSGGITVGEQIVGIAGAVVLHLAIIALALHRASVARRACQSRDLY